MRSYRLQLVAAMVVLLVTAGMGLANAQGATVNVELAEFTIAPDVSSVSAGDIEFVATNSGEIEHELVILKTDLAPDALPVAGGRVTESAAGIDEIGEIETFPAGTTESGTFTLAAGKYVLICNIAGHYEGGMTAAFTVTGAAGEPAATATAPAAKVPSTGSGGAPATGDGLPKAALIVALTVLGGAMLAAGGGWATLRSRR